MEGQEHRVKPLCLTQSHRERLVRWAVPRPSRLLGSGIPEVHTVVVCFPQNGVSLMAEFEFLLAKVALSVKESIGIGPDSCLVCSRAVCPLQGPAQGTAPFCRGDAFPYPGRGCLRIHESCAVYACCTAEEGFGIIPACYPLKWWEN